ncbi:MAG: N-acetylmuramoyl-L-alanine amidase [Solirubrobacterales bacterium]
MPCSGRWETLTIANNSSGSFDLASSATSVFGHPWRSPSPRAPSHSSPASAAAPSGADFTQELPAVETLRPTLARTAALDGDRGYGYLGHGPVIFRSRARFAPERFDLVGVAGETHALEYRTRRDATLVGATGSRPTTAIRSTRAAPISCRCAAAASRSTATHYARPRRQVGSCLAACGSRLGQHRPQEAPRAEALGRWQWRRGGGRLPRSRRSSPGLRSGERTPRSAAASRATPETGRIKAGVIHHTVSTNTYTQAEAPGLVLGICRYHRNANGWNDIGYNALVDRFGNLYEGRAGGLSRAIIGAQAEGINSQTTGIASIGDNREETAGPKEVKAIVKYLAWKFGIAGIPASGRATLTSAGGSTQRTPAGERMRVPRIFPHMETNFTECAGAALNAQVPLIRRKVSRRLGY